jgi:hypothetical protein
MVYLLLAHGITCFQVFLFSSLQINSLQIKSFRPLLLESVCAFILRAGSRTLSTWNSCACHPCITFVPILPGTHPTRGPVLHLAMLWICSKIPFFNFANYLGLSHFWRTQSTSSLPPIWTHSKPTLRLLDRQKVNSSAPVLSAQKSQG